MRSARAYQRFHLALAVGGAAGLLTVAVALLRSIRFAPPTLDSLWEACRGAFGDLSVASALVLALGALTLICVLRGLRSGWRQLRAHRLLIRRIRTLDEVQVAGSRVGLLVDDDPRAFCAGLLRPRVYLSVGALRTLPESELRAVLAHEAHHCRQRDPLRLLMARIVADGLFFLPVLRHAHQRSAALAEVAADEAAVRATGDPQPLASAMLRFEEIAGATAVGIAPERVDHLLGRPARWELSLSLLVGGAVTLLGLVVLGIGAASAAPTGGLTISGVVMEVCAIAMVALPALAALWVAGTLRRTLRR